MTATRAPESPAHRRRRLRARAGTALVCVVAGLLIAASTELARSAGRETTRNTDLAGLVERQQRRQSELADEIVTMRAKIDKLTAEELGNSRERDPAAGLVGPAGLLPVDGPGVTVTLRDAPLEVKPKDVDEDLLVVHQQDIQAVLNVLWGAGAEAITLQGQRVMSVTSAKCVGNTVVIHGVPYAPPYVISAIGDPDRLEAYLNSDPAVVVYKQYAATYKLGWEAKREARLTMPGYKGAVELRYAQPGK